MVGWWFDRELYYVICCDTMWYYVMLCYTMLYYLVLCYTMLYYVLLYYKVPCYTTLVLSRNYHAMWDMQCCVCQQYSKNISVWIILSPVCMSLSYTSNIYRSYWSNWFQRLTGLWGASRQQSVCKRVGCNHLLIENAVLCQFRLEKLYLYSSRMAGVIFFHHRSISTLSVPQRISGFT